MKKSTVLLIAAAVMLSSCGTAAQMASSGSGQRFSDGIYSSAPSIRTKAEKMEDKAQTEALVEKTKASEIYLFGDKKDTVMIPDNMAATIKYDRSLGSTVVSVYENPYDWRNNIVDPWYYYTPYSIGSSWYWSRHYHPWYYGSVWARPYWRYDPWYYGFYDPWYYGGWYDPWYYSYAGWYDPWYYMHPHYAGWYGGWYDPYWGHHHHHHGPGHGPVHKPDDDHRPRVYTGTRHSTGSDRVFAGNRPLRGGSSVSSRPVNRTTATSGTAVTSRPAAGKSGITRTSSAVRDRQTAAAKNPASVTARPSSGRTATVTRTAPGVRTGSTVRQSATGSGSGRTATTSRQPNHRRPVVTSPGSPTGTHNRGFSSQATENRSTSSGQSYRSSRSENTYDRSSSQTYERSSSSQSYNRSAGTSSYNRSSSSSSTRSYGGGGGGGVSRSGGSSGGGMRR